MATNIEELPVHSLSSNGYNFKVQNFIRREQDWPGITHDNFDTEEDVPVISLRGLLLPATNNKVNDQQYYEDVCKEMVTAGSKWGFFKLVDHGVGVEIMEKTIAEVGGAFELPMEEKMRGSRSEVLSPLGKMSPLGYSSTVPELGMYLPWTENILLRQSPEDVVAFGKKVYGQQHHTFSSTLIEYMQEVDNLGQTILRMLARGLGLPDDFFASNFEDKTENTIRLNSYPPCPVPEKCLGLGSHSDLHALTILLQDGVGGLQVLNGHNNQWTGIRPVPNSFVVNIGDVLEAWTNSKRRVSVAHFLCPERTVSIECPPQLVDPETNPRKYLPFTWEQFSDQLKSEKKIAGKTALDRYRISLIN